MTERIQEELELIRSFFPDLEYREQEHWVRIPAYPVPEAWGVTASEVAFKMPPGLPNEPPYGFWVHPPLALPGGGVPTNTSGPIATGFGDGWQQYSWAPEVWNPAEEVRQGTNMLDFARSIGDRLKEVN